MVIIFALTLGLLMHTSTADAFVLGKPFPPPRDTHNSQIVYAITDSGEIFAAYPATRDHRQVVIFGRLNHHGRIIDRQAVKMPEGATNQEGSEPATNPINLTVSHNRVALTDVNYDSCCDSVGAATWRLGTTPPVLTELSLQNEEAKVLGVPQVVIDHGRVFVVWLLDNEGQESIDVAKSKGSRYTVRVLHRFEVLSPDGIFSLRQDGSGSPIVFWEEDPLRVGSDTLLYTATMTNKETWRLVRSKPGPTGPSTVLEAPSELATDDAGNQAFIYEPKEFQLWIVIREVGHAFGDAHMITRHFDSAAVAAGGHGTTVIAWTTKGHNYVTVEVGNILDGFGPPQRIYTTFPEEVHVAVDNRGRAILMWNSENRRADKAMLGIRVAVAGIGGRFSSPILVSSPRSGYCSFTEIGQIIIQSPDGHSLLSWNCGEIEYETHFLTRYKP